MKSVLAAATWLLMSSCGLASAADADLRTLKLSYQRPTAVPFPEQAAYSPQMATLGKMLFFEPRLSGAQNLSCAPAVTTPPSASRSRCAGAIGSANTPLARKANTILNAAWSHQPVLGRARQGRSRTQAVGPITTPAEMNGKFPAIVEPAEGRARNTGPGSTGCFRSSGVTKDNLLTAIATYERTVMAGDVAVRPMGRWRSRAAMTPVGGAGVPCCSTARRAAPACHSGWNFTDNKFHDIGLARPTTSVEASSSPTIVQAQCAFKTPGLRNLIYRAPFGHHGQFPDIGSIVDFYITGGIDRPSKSPLIRPLSLDQSEVQDLIAFLKSLTAEKTETALPNLPN